MFFVGLPEDYSQTNPPLIPWKHPGLAITGGWQSFSIDNCVLSLDILYKAKKRIPGFWDDLRWISSLYHPIHTHTCTYIYIYTHYIYIHIYCVYIYLQSKCCLFVEYLSHIFNMFNTSRCSALGTWCFFSRRTASQALVYIEDTGADNDGQIGTGIDVMVPTNGPDSHLDGREYGRLDDSSGMIVMMSPLKW